MHLRKTHLVAIIGLLYAVLMLALASWVVYTVVMDGISLKDKARTIAETNAKIQSYKELQERVVATSEMRESLSKFVITDNETGSFLTEIEKLGESLGVKMTTTSLAEEKVEGGLNILQIQFVLEGQEEQVKNMILLFETLPYHSKMGSLSFVRQDEGRAKAVIDLSVTLVPYDK